MFHVPPANAESIIHLFSAHYVPEMAVKQKLPVGVPVSFSSARSFPPAILVK